MNSSDDEQRHIDAIEEPSSREPRPTDWGFCAYGDASPAIGGGMPWFYWFENEQAMLAALREHAAYLNPPPSDRSVEDLQSAVADILSFDVRFPDDAVRARLNEALQNASQFEWLGSFEQLTKGAASLKRRSVTNSEKTTTNQPMRQSRQRTWAASRNSPAPTAFDAPDESTSMRFSSHRVTGSAARVGLADAGPRPPSTPRAQLASAFS